MISQLHQINKSVLNNKLVKSIALALCLNNLPGYSVAAEVEVIKPSQESHTLTPQKAPRIQVSILLDTSSSMDGLINQTREQLWQMVDQFSKAEKDGVTPILEVSVYEYGNSGLSAQVGHTRQVTAFTQDLDIVSEALFSLTTNGGNEFCGYAIDKALKQLQWSNSDQDIKVIFIAGNEPFTQGPVHYTQAIEYAKSKGVVVNTIFAGQFHQGTNTGWQQGALLAGGSYMNIDQNHQIAHIEAPQDAKIAELNMKLNDTYVPYGQKGQKSAMRQKVQDSNSNKVSLGLLAERVKSKISSAYKASSWDLVDAVEEGTVELEQLAPTDLPAPIAKMDKEKQKSYIAEKAKERKKIKEEISRLAAERDEYVAEQREASPASPEKTMGEALAKSVKQIGEKKKFEFESTPSPK